MISVATEKQPLRSSRSIQEFRIDFLLEEEFNVDPSFARKFTAACRPELSFTGIERVIHSVTDKHGEADLVVVVSATMPNGETSRLALLIEDKITAGFQPEQAARYHSRGAEGVTNGHWTCFVSVLVAPSAYISDGHGFDAAISLEHVKEWICADDIARRRFKIAKIDEAISKRNATGVQVVDPVMTAFRAAYYNYLGEFNKAHGTDFTMRAPAETYWGDTWFVLRSPSLPNSARIRHMPQPGNIELTFRDINVSTATDLSGLLDPEMRLIPTGKYNQHSTIRCAAPKIPTFDDFARDQPKVEAALLSAKKLWLLVERERARIEQILTSASAA